MQNKLLAFVLRQFISTDAYGICVRVFCDFGKEFEVSDPTGEEPKEIFIQTITQVVSSSFTFSPWVWVVEDEGLFEPTVYGVSVLPL